MVSVRALIGKFGSKCIARVRHFLSGDKNIYLIYSMGKVGSDSIYRMLREAKPYCPVFHVHFLSKYWLNERLPAMPESFLHNITTGNKILTYIKQNPGRRIKVITLVREPVMRDISDLFENWSHLYDDIEKIKQEELKERIENLDHSYTTTWFDSEFYEHLGVNIFDLPFSPQKGYEIYNLDKFDLLCMRLESLNTIADKAFGDFMKISPKLLTTNSSMNKKGSNQYVYVKNNVRIPRDKLNELYKSKLVTHFYSGEEIAGFKEKWSD